MSDISQRIQRVQTPIIPEVADLINLHPGTISLGQGVVYYKPPMEVSKGVAKFMESNSHHYEAVEGLPELRELICSKLQQENQIDTDQYETVVCAGSNMGFLNAILAICDSGDEIILHKPWYFNHEMAVRIADCVPISSNIEETFGPPSPTELENLITPHTRAIVTISPNNPTGAVYDAVALIAINELCARRNIYHIHDEAYEYFCYGDAIHYSPASASSAAGHTISLFSTSKSFGFANWRIGYMLIPSNLFKSIRKIQDTNLICPPVISQFAAMECLKLGRDFCTPKISKIAAVREYFAEKISSIQAISHGELAGAFYGFLQLPEIGMSDMEIVEYLIKRHKVAVIPGSAFGIEKSTCLRVSYGALEPKNAIEGIDRLTVGLKELLAGL